MRSPVKFWDKIAQRYSKQPVADEESYQKKIEITQQYLKPEMEVLEFGCGTGSTAISHAPFVNRILAIDLSSKMIEIAQGKANSQNITNVTFEAKSIEDLNAPEKHFDVVMAHSTLHLLENKSEVVGSVYDHLKNGGYFISSTMCLGDSLKFKFISAFISFAAYFGLLPKLNVFTSENLFASLGDAGFEIEYQWQPKKDSALFIVAKKP